MFHFQGVFLVHSVHVHNRTGLEEGVELYGHAETTKHHVSVAVLGAKRLVCHFKTRGAVDGAVNPGHLKRVVKVFVFIQSISSLFKK